MNRKPFALALGFVLPFCGALALLSGVLSSETLYPTALFLTASSAKTDREGASPVVLVEIDNAAQDAQGPWPWPASRLDALLLSIANSGARAVVVDQSLFSDPAHSPTPSLWAALPGGLPVVLPTRSRAQTTDSCPLWNVASTAADADLRPVAPSTTPQGVPCGERFSAGFDTLVPADGSLAYPLLWNDGKHIVPSLPLVALQVSLPNSSPGSVWWNSRSRTVVGSHGNVKVDARGAVLLRPLGAPGQGVPRVNAATVLSQDGTSDLFRGRIVVVGVTASGLVPTCSVPFTAALAGDRMSRAEATATALLNLLDRSTILEPS